MWGLTLFCRHLFHRKNAFDILHNFAPFLLERLKLQTNECCCLVLFKDFNDNCRRVWRLLYNEARWRKVIYVLLQKRRKLRRCNFQIFYLHSFLTPLSHDSHSFHFSTSASSSISSRTFDIANLISFRSSIDAKLDYIIRQLAAEKA